MVSQQVSLPSLLALKSILHMVVLCPCLQSFIGFHSPQDELQVTPVTYKAVSYLAPVCLSSLLFLCFLPRIPYTFSLPKSAHVFPPTWAAPWLVNACSFSKMLRHCSPPWGPLSLGYVLPTGLSRQLLPPCPTCAHVCVLMHVCMCLNGCLLCAS